MTLQVDIQAQLGDLSLDVQFDAPVGVTVLFGPSGAGKTSVINAIAGLIKPDKGLISLDKKVLYDGQNSVAVHRRKVGYVFQDARLFPHMTVLQNLTYGGRNDFDRIIDILGLRDLLDRRPAGLSGGEKQRVALGRALMAQPDVVLMDEPLAALDGPRKAEVLPYIADIAATQKIPVIYVTHAMAEVTQLADQLVVIDQGQVVRKGPVFDVLADPMAARFFAKRDAGALVSCVVDRHDLDEGVTVLASGAGPILLPGQVGKVGAGLRLRIPAQDVILAQTAPVGQSALNAIATVITEVTPLPNGNLAVMLRAKELPIWAEITPLSVRRLGLETEQNVFAIFKATAVGPV
ncbi:molybdenum ABC transporter ATP-binding protein [Loktanella sp. F6476L]|uniref:molybdenum ABC transporter ATP-binding protein n=1 Tax=Loktanella sp. F6476L TaxID=2926405 RepID=UPI001FF13136|nr:molybdenum ABC transporter ATP-binding protein [Loktanella sp. F6476L]MCK0119205.1 molybdenum ABC transporter ATP-binding protein [Loktanella sp. F6476L]